MSVGVDSPLTAAVGTWNVDPVHSSIEFQVRNMGIVTVKGFFDEFSGDVELGADGAGSAAGVVQAASVHTRSEKRDAHLRAPDFFDVEAYPEITFRSTRIEPLGDDRFLVVGDLTIKGRTHELELDARLEGSTSDPWGGERVGISASGELDRRDFGLEWDVRTPGGAPLASHRVKLELQIGAVKAR